MSENLKNDDLLPPQKGEVLVEARDVNDMYLQPQASAYDLANDPHRCA
jgi:hypothetical protein